MITPRDRPPKETEDKLRLRIERATVELLSARAEGDRLGAISADLADTPDGVLAIRNAAQQQREATERLRDALRALTAFNKKFGRR
jgi:hypothetical protein